MNIKRIVLSLLAGVVGAAVMSVSAMAADTLPEANDGVITLTEDVILTSTYVISEDVVIDLADHTITTSEFSGEGSHVKTLIYIKDEANVTIKNGTVKGGTRSNLSDYNGLYYTINVENSVLTIENATIIGSKGVNTKYGATAVNASKGSEIEIIDSEIYGGDVEKVGITSDTYTNYFFRNEGKAGTGVYIHDSDLIVTDSEIYGGKGLAGEGTQKNYISGGANYANGAPAIQASQNTSAAYISGSIIVGGNSDLYNAEDGIALSFGASLTVEDSAVTGGSCLEKNGYGIAGAGIYVNMGASQVNVSGSSIVGGDSDDSYIGSGIEVGSNSSDVEIEADDCTIAAGTGSGDSKRTYAIEAVDSDDIKEIVLTDVALDVNGNKSAVSSVVGAITAEGKLTVDGGSLGNVTVNTFGGVEVEGDGAGDVTPVKMIAKVGDNYYPSIELAVEAANTGDTVTILPGTYEGGFSVGKDIILEGTIVDGEIATIFEGENDAAKSYYWYSIYMNKGTIRNVKIINAWKGIMTEGSGSLTIDNVEMEGIGYGVHIAEAKGAEDVVTIKNSNIDITWANSFAKGDYKIVVENNVFTSENPYYPDYGTLAVNTNASKVVIKDNNFGTNVKIYVDANNVPDISNIVIGANYYADGVENAFPVDEEGVIIPIYTEYKTPEMDEEVFTSVLKATLDGEYYPSIQSAVDASTPENNVIIVAPGTHNEALSVNKSVVLTGNPNYGVAALLAEGDIEKPVINISNVTNGGVKYEAADITFDNLVFNVLADATGETWNVSAIGYYYENVKNREGLTVTNCDFINNSDISMSAIAANLSEYTVKNNTFKNFKTIIHSFMDNSAVNEIVVENNTYENVKEIVSIYYGADGGEGLVTVKNNTGVNEDGSLALVDIDDYARWNAADTTAFENVIIEDNTADVVFRNYTTAYTSSVTGNSGKTTYNYRTKSLLDAIDALDPNVLPEGVVYVDRDEAETLLPTPEMYIVENGAVKAEATSVELVFEENTEDATALDNSVWDIYLVANQGGILNRLNSADFTFEIATDEAKDAMSYEIVATNSEIVINNVNNDANRYEFHYDGKTGTITDTATKIKIGTVKFTGYGAFTFQVDTTDIAENTNTVHTTKFVDSIVDTFVVTGAVDAVDADGDLVVNGEDGIIDSEIIVPTQALTINIDFPNSVSDNVVAYQQMKVTVSGGDLEQALVVDLGTDKSYSDLTVYDNKKDVTVEISDLYTVEIENLLTINTTYTVTVEGAGYRTARYNVTMTQDKTLNFWNNVKDNAAEVETGKTTSAKNVTYLAGDIVKDNLINIYDLSAVVSYFGEVELVGNNNTYAKYDLNRDGKIDSKDVAYVLVSWNN